MKNMIKKWEKRCIAFLLVVVLMMPDFVPEKVMAADYNIVSVGDYLYPGDVFTNMVCAGDHVPECMFVFHRDGSDYKGENTASPIETETEGIYTYTLPDFSTACDAGFLPEIAAQSDKVFVCWKVTAAYMPEGTALNAVVLTAVMADRYTISYDWQGATPPASYPTSYLVSERGVVAGSLPMISKDGYIFEGWYTDDEFAEESKITSITEGQTGNLKLYPKFILNNIATPAPAPTLETPEEIPTPEPTPTLETPEESSTPEPTPTLEIPEESSTPEPTPTIETPETTWIPASTPSHETPKATATPTLTPEPTLTLETPEPTATPESPELTPLETTKGSKNIYIDDSGRGRYRIKKKGDGTKKAIYVGPTKKKYKKVTIPGKASIQGVRYRVVAIEKNALKNCKKLKRVKIGKNVKKIGKKAFYGCKSLKKLEIRTKKLTAKKVKKKAFGKTYKKMTVKVPKKRLKRYKKLFRKRGIKKKAKFKRIR